MKSPVLFLLEVIRPYWFWYALMFQAPLLGSFYHFANQYSMKLLVDAFSMENPPAEVFIHPVVLFVSAQILLDLIWRVSNVAEWKCEPYVRRAIFLKAYDYVQHHSFSFFQNTPAGSITSKIKGIVDGYDHIFSQLHHQITSKLAITLVLISVLALVSLPLFGFMVIWSILVFIVMYRMSVRLKEYQYQETECRHRILGQIADNVTNIFSIFFFATKKKELKSLESMISNDFIPKQIRGYRYDFKLYWVGGIFYWFMLFSVFFFMIHLRRTQQVTSGDFVFVMGVTLVLAQYLWESVTEMQHFMRHWGDFKASFSLLQTPHADLNDSSFKDLKVARACIQFHDVSFGYEAHRPIFEGLHLTVRGGEKLGLVGLSGAGKSTLVSLLLKNFSIQKGRIEIDGQSLTELRTDSVREKIALIPQDIMLFHRTLLENIRYGRLNASDEEVFEAARKAKLHDFILTLPEQYQTFVGERGVKLSGGQRQRVAIARAILKQAPILILDEATSSLDSESEREIQQSIQEMLQTSQATVIAIAHRLSTLKYMDRILVLEGGKILEEGSHQQLIQKEQGLYQRLWEMQRGG